MCSSMIETILMGRPSVVESNWKSTAHTRSGASAVTVGGGGGAVPFAASPLRHAQPFFTLKSLYLLVIHLPSLGAGVVIGRPKPTTRMVLGVLAQPGPHRCVRIVRRGRDGFVALGGAILPVDAAGEPFAEPQHPLEVTNGCPSAFRA